MQSKQRTEIVRWVQECLLKEKGSIVFIRDRVVQSSSLSPSHSPLLPEEGLVDGTLSDLSMSFGESPTHSRNMSRRSSTTSGSNFSTPKREAFNGGMDPFAFPGTRGLTKSQSFTASVRQISELCFNNSSVKLRRLLWEEDGTRAIVLLPVVSQDFKHLG